LRAAIGAGGTLAATVAAGAILPAPAGAGPRATASAHTGGIPINVRAGAALSHARLATIPDGARLRVVCEVRGQGIVGYVRGTDRWDRLADGRYVSDANVAWRPARPALPTCRSAPARPAAQQPGGSATASTGGVPLNLRTEPSTGRPRAGTVPDGSRLAVVCQVSGENVVGHARTTDVWDRLSNGRYVSDANVAWRPARPTVPTCGSAPPASRPDAVSTEPAAFIARFAGPARASMRRHGVPASVTIAQAILESGWGRSELAYADHNYFGIKCFGEPGPVATGCRSYATHECAGQRCFATEATFRVYADLAASVYDHGRFLAIDNPRYRPAFAHTRAPDRFTTEIHKAGYATSPGYAKAIIGLMRQYDLYRYDR
jgi:flagellar protein FlgJ